MSDAGAEAGARSVGIDGKANAAGRRHSGGKCKGGLTEAAA